MKLNKNVSDHLQITSHVFTAMQVDFEDFDFMKTAVDSGFFVPCSWFYEILTDFVQEQRQEFPQFV